MLWKRLYGDDIWAHHDEELQGLFIYFFPSYIFLSANANFKICKCIDLIYIKFVIFKLYVGLNKDFKKMLSENAEFKAISLKDMLTASDGTKKVDVISCFILSIYNA